MQVILVKEKYHETIENCHGALWAVNRGKRTVNFIGVCSTPDLDKYLVENPDIKVKKSIPSGYQIEHNGY